PDGTHIAFDTADTTVFGAGLKTKTSSHLYVMASNGTHVHDLGYGAGPDWAPDGSRIVFSLFIGYTSVIEAVSADGMRSQILTDARVFRGKFPIAPRYSPDGSTIVFGFTSNG